MTQWSEVRKGKGTYAFLAKSHPRDVLSKSLNVTFLIKYPDPKAERRKPETPSRKDERSRRLYYAESRL